MDSQASAGFRPAVRLNHNSHVSLEFRRGSKWSEYVAYEPSGPQKYREPTESYLAEFYWPSEVSARSAALTMLRSCRMSFMPGEGVSQILMEVYMTEAKVVEVPKDLTKLDTKELLVVHNELAKALGKKELKDFKQGKLLLVTRITEMRDSAGQLTPAQEAAKEAQLAAATKRLEKLVAADQRKAEARNRPAPGKQANRPTQSTKENDMAAIKKAATKKAAPAPKKAAPAPKKAAPAPKKAAAKPAAKAGAPKKQGIGAFCIELIGKGKSNEEILAAVKKQFPDASTSASSVAWYRNKVKNEGNA